MIPLLIILAVILTFFLLGVTQYNRLVRSRQMTQEGLSGIDVQLKRRADLIPNLLETVKGYMGHERQVLERVTELRTRSLQAGSVAEKGQVEGMLTEALRTLFAVAENYPDLKASQNFMELQQSWWSPFPAISWLACSASARWNTSNWRIKPTGPCPGLVFLDPWQQ
jgi:LemA protein